MKRIIFSFFLIFACLSLLLQSSCKKDIDEGYDSNPSQTKDGYDVIVYDSLTISNTFVYADSSKIIFMGLVSEENPEINDIICSAPTDEMPYGFLYKVNEVTTTGDSTIINFEQAELADAVEEGSISMAINLNDYIIEESYREKSCSVNAEEKTTTFEIDTTFKSGNSKLTLFGDVTVSNTLNFDIDISTWSINYLYLTFKNETSSHLTLTGEISKEVSKEFTPFTLKLKPVTIFIAQVPVVIRPVIKIILSLSASGKIIATVDIIDASFTAEIGAKYENSEIKPVSKKTFENNSLKDPGDVVVSGELKATVSPCLSFLLYNSKNMVTTLKPGVYGKIFTEDLSTEDKYDIDPKLKGTVGLQAGIEAKLKILWKELLNLDESIELYSYDVFEWAVFPVFSNMAFKDTTEVSVNASCYVESDTSRNLFTIYEHGLCWGTDALPTIEDEHTTINGFTEYSASNPLETEIDGLNDNTTYYVVPYFTNILGTYYGKVGSFTTEKEEHCWQVEITLDIDGEEECYSTKMYLDGYSDDLENIAYLPDFKYTEFGWSNSWYNGFIMGTSFYDSSIDDWNNNGSNRCVTFYCTLPTSIGDESSGTIKFSADCFYGECGCGSSWSGEFTITKIECE